jgi:hypothetical protein
LKSDIILVGNGSSLLNKENKELIDSYKTVVRFNSYKINGFEKYVGTKTDIWFTVNKHHFDHIKHYNKVITHSWAKTNCQLYNSFKLERDDVEKVNYEIIDEIPVSYPSTGLIAVYYFNKKVDLIGFDWWDNNKHHYGDNELRGTLHKPHLEYKVIKSLDINIIS